MTGRDFRKWREGLGLSQAGAAEVLGKSRRTIQYWEEHEEDEVERIVYLATRWLSVALRGGELDLPAAVVRS